MNYASPFKRTPSNRVGYKLAAGGSAMDVEMGDVSIDENEMSVAFPFADGRRRDGVGDLLEIAGISTERHRKNPVVLFDHGKQVVLPVAMAEDPFSRQYTVNLDPAAKVANVKAFFYQGKGDIGGQSADYEHSLFCHQLFDLIARKFVRGGSIGYQVVHARELTPDYERGTPKGLHLLQTLMLEASAVVMPANMDTVKKCLALPNVCGKPMSRHLIKSLTPYLTEKKTMVTGGFSLPVEAIKSVRMNYRVKAKDASYANSTDFEVGQKVVARSYIAYMNKTTRKTEPFAASGDRLELIEDNGATFKVRRADGETTIVTRGDIRKKGLDTSIKSIRMKYRGKAVDAAPNEGGPGDPPKQPLPEGKALVGAKSLPTGGNDLKSIRMKYRKGMARRIKRGTPSQSMVYTSEKDLPRIKEAAKAKGVGCQFMGTHKSGMEKVKLTGDDNAIDELSKTFGRRYKSLDGGGMNPDVMGDTDVMGMPAPVDAEPIEPHGASMLRRFHEDHSILMKDYHDAMQRLEPDSAVRKYIETSLAGMEKALGGAEALFSKHYKDLPPLEGAMEAEVDIDADGDLDVAADDIPEPKMTDAMPADSSPPGEPEEEDPVTMDDIETKRLKGGTKAGKFSTGHPGIQTVQGPGGRKESITGTEERVRAAARDMEKRGLSVRVFQGPNGWEARGKSMDDMPPGTDSDADIPTEPTEEPALEKAMKALEDGEKDDVREACDFAKELSEAQTLEDDHRQKSFHYHKSMNKLCGVKNAAPGTPPATSDDFQKSMEDLAASADMHPHRKACKTAGDYFGRMAKEKAFGDAHREEAAACAADMEKALSGEESTPADDMEGVEGMPEPGEMGEKLLAQQAAKIGELEYKIKRLAEALSGARR